MGALWVIGDSWSDPQRVRVGLDGWPVRVARSLGLGVVNAAAGGAGYAQWNGTPLNFPVLAMRHALPTADVAIIFGSVNDRHGQHPPEVVTAAALDTYRLVSAIAPAAQLIVLGPQWGGAELPGAGDWLWRTIGAVRLAAARAGAEFVDTHRWFLGHTHLFDGGGTHPDNDGGQQRLADLIAPHVQQALLRSRARDGGFPYPMRYPLDYRATPILSP